ncbi:MAG: right-handed parallel beta-helix repeat-containing protein [Myxococcota bacterium]
MFRFHAFVLPLVIGLVGCGDGDGDGNAGGSGGAGGGDSSVWPCTEQGVRDAVEAGGGPHTFSCDGPTVVTTEGTIEISGEVILDGENNLTLSGNQSHRIFFLERRGFADLRNMTLTQGNADGAGGAILNDGGDLLLEGCIVTDNEASSFGGGIVSSQGLLEIVGSNITRNEAPQAGGISCTGTVSIDSSDITANVGRGISCAGQVTIVDSVISDNEGGGVSIEGTVQISGSNIDRNRSEIPGGGIYNSGHLVLNDSWVSENEAVRGGGIFNEGSLSMNSTTVAGNNAQAGGGIFSSDQRLGEGLQLLAIAWMDIGHSTISGNTAERGAGISSVAFRLAVWNTTISGNVATQEGGGVLIRTTLLGPSTNNFDANTIVENIASETSAIRATGETPMLRLSGNIIEGDCTVSGGALLRSGGHNIESPGDTCGLDDSSDLANVTNEQLSLASLENNGGDTQTHLPMTGSVAIDRIPIEDCASVLPPASPLVDQRFIERPQGPGCDVGSAEVGP